MAIIQEIDIDVIPQTIPVIVPINQNDVGTGRIKINLFKEGTEYDLTNETVKVQGTKSNGVGFQHDVTFLDNVVTVDIVDDMTDVCGDVRTQLLIVNGNNKTGTMIFILRVQPEAYIPDV